MRRVVDIIVALFAGIAIGGIALGVVAARAWHANEAEWVARWDLREQGYTTAEIAWRDTYESKIDELRALRLDDQQVHQDDLDRYDAAWRQRYRDGEEEWRERDAAWREWSGDLIDEIAYLRSAGAVLEYASATEAMLGYVRAFFATHGPRCA